MLHCLPGSLCGLSLRQSALTVAAVYLLLDLALLAGMSVLVHHPQTVHLALVTQPELGPPGAGQDSPAVRPPPDLSALTHLAWAICVTTLALAVVSAAVDASLLAAAAVRQRRVALFWIVWYGLVHSVYTLAGFFLAVVAAVEFGASLGLCALLMLLLGLVGVVWYLYLVVVAFWRSAEDRDDRGDDGSATPMVTV